MGAIQDLLNQLNQVTAAANTAQNAVNNIGGGGGGGGGGTNPGTVPGGVGNVSSAGAVAALTGGTPAYADSTARSNLSRYAKYGLKGVGGSILGLQSMLPTAEEAISLNLIGNRQGFYSGTGPNLQNAYNLQQQVGGMGTSTGAFDVVNALNAGAGMGLLPGLSNAGITQGFGGIAGGAALASNLTPGMGISGGMAAMAQINQASTVNRLKMIGVDVRNKNGEMRDLPDIIEQIYNLLKKGAGKEPTAALISVSAMSGNALDSLLTQFFGSDSEARQTVLTGLLQMANTKGESLSTSGNKSALEKTGGLTSTVSSLANRSNSELKMLQNWEAATNKATGYTNEIGSGLFDFLGSQSTNSGAQGLQMGLTGLTVFGGLRGGAGQMITDSVLGAGVDGGKNLFGGLSDKVKLGVGATGLLGALAGTAALGAAAGADTKYEYTDAVTQAPAAAAANTGTIIINVTAPTSDDPYSWANVIGNSIASVKKA